METTVGSPGSSSWSRQVLILIGDLPGPWESSKEEEHRAPTSAYCACEPTEFLELKCLLCLRHQTQSDFFHIFNCFSSFSRFSLFQVNS